MNTKKGGVEVQFNWVFVFVAGTLILAFFVGFVMSQKQVADKKLASRILRDTNTILTQSKLTAGKSDYVPLVKPLTFSCDPETCTDQGCTSADYWRMVGDSRSL